MGSMASRHLAAIDAVDDLVLADLDAAALDATVWSIPVPGCRVSTETADLLDPAAARRLLDGADLVVNCAGPFFRLGVPTLEAAIDAGAMYLDICDDPDPTAEMLELDERARAAGVAAVIGMGASPGVSNLLAARAARRLDTVEDCFTAWPLDIPAPGQNTVATDEAETSDGSPSAAAIHLMEQISGEVLVVEDGRPVRRRPLQPVGLHYPGLGDGTGYTVGHPEPLTLRSSLGVSGRTANLMLMRRSTTAYLKTIQRELDAGTLGLDAAARLVLRPTAWRSARAALGGVRSEGHGALPTFFAVLHGTRSGQRRVAGCRLTTAPSGMDGGTAIPAVLAARQMLASPPDAGVHPPEAVIDADRLLTDLVEHCQPSAGSLDELAPVVDAPRP